MENVKSFDLSVLNRILTTTFRVLGLILVFPLALILTPETLLILLICFLQFIVVYRVVLLGIPSGFKELGNRAFDANDYKAEMRLFVISMLFTVLLSVGGFFIIRFSHNIVAYTPIIDQVIRINKILSIAIIPTAILSILKAYLKPRIEEMNVLGNVIYRGVILLSVLVAIILSFTLAPGDLVFVIAIGLLSASVIALGYFGYYFYKSFTDIKYAYNYETEDTRVKIGQLLLHLFKNSLPYVIMFSIIPLYRLFDIYILQIIINSTATIQETVEYTFNVYYLIIFFGTILTLIGSVYVYRVAKDFSINNLSGVDKNVNKATHIILYFGLPLMAYLMLFADQFYGIIFGGTSVLMFAAPYVVLIPLLIVSSKMVNLINRTSYLWYSMLFGLFLKVVTTYAISIYMGTSGAIVATHIGLLSTVIMNYMILKTYTLFDGNYMVKRTGMLLLITVVMTGVLVFVDQLLMNTINYEVSFLNNLLYVLITFVLSVVLYFVMSLYTGLFQIVSEADIHWSELYDEVEEWEDDELLW